MLMSQTEEFLESPCGSLGIHWDAPGLVADKEMPENFLKRGKSQEKQKILGKFLGRGKSGKLQGIP